MRVNVLQSLELIYGKCIEDGECRLWQGAMNRQYPIHQMKDPTKKHGQRQVHVRRRVWELAKGQQAKPGPRYVLVANCGNDRCVSEACLQVITKSKRLRQVAATGVFSSLAFRAKVSAGRRRGSELSDDAVSEIRTSEEPVAVLAERHSLSKGYTYAVKQHRNRRDYTSPFAALLPVLERA